VWSRATESLVRRNPRDVVGRLILMVHKPFTYQVRPVQGPGSPGELFVEGERFNIQRFYDNQTSGFYMSMGRMFTPDVPFDPFSVRNLAMAMPSWTTNPLQPPSREGYSTSFPMPLSPQSAAQAGRAIAANPQNAQSILNQLETNPANRMMPQGFWFPLMNPSYEVTCPKNMAAFVRQVQMSQNDPNSPLHMAIQLGHIENSPASRSDASAATAKLLEAQQVAAQRDIQIGQDLQNVAQSNLNLRQQLAMDVQFIESVNAEIRFYDDRALPVLKAITGLDLGVEQEKWKAWWKGHFSSAYLVNVNMSEVERTYREFVYDWTHLGSVAPSPMPERAPTYIDSAVKEPVPAASPRACFAAGTLVQTIEGPRPIEFIQVGDRVLSQNTTTGLLKFAPMLAIHGNHPAPTFRVKIGGETIVATGIQGFWKAGKGWTMTHDLKAGDRLRMLGGVVAIEAIETDKPQPVYNVDIAQDGDLFVGKTGLLAHDFRFVQPVLEPFDRQPELPAPPAPAR
jgi:Pretoxin HINT domain